MIRCGLAKDIDGYSGVSQLSKELQMRVQKYPEHFTGTPVPDSAGPASEMRDISSGVDARCILLQTMLTWCSGSKLETILA